MNKLIPLRTALESPDWLGSVLGAPSYATVRSLLLAALGEPLTADELAVFTKITGRAESPSEPVAELWLVAGRRSGKTLAIAVLAAFLAGCCDHRSVLAPGERGTVIILAANMSQGHPALNILKSIFTDIPRFAGLVDKISFDTISLLNRIDIRIRPPAGERARSDCDCSHCRGMRGLVAGGRRLEEPRPADPQCGAASVGDHAGRLVCDWQPAIQAGRDLAHVSKTLLSEG